MIVLGKTMKWFHEHTFQAVHELHCSHRADARRPARAVGCLSSMSAGAE